MTVAGGQDLIGKFRNRMETSLTPEIVPSGTDRGTRRGRTSWHDPVPISALLLLRSDLEENSNRCAYMLKVNIQQCFEPSCWGYSLLEIRWLSSYSVQLVGWGAQNAF